jgi:signal peptidase I
MKKDAIWSLAGGIGGALLVVAGLVALRVSVLNPYSVPSSSMFPTVRAGQTIWGYKLAYRKPADVHRGDLVVHRLNQEIYVKRVVGLPGDTIRTAGEKVYVNGTLLPQRPVRMEDGLNIFTESLDGRSYEVAEKLPVPRDLPIPNVSITVPADSFFLLGDNRTNSFDSRHTGCIAWPQIIGRILQ